MITLLIASSISIKRYLSTSTDTIYYIALSVNLIDVIQITFLKRKQKTESITCDLESQNRSCK